MNKKNHNNNIKTKPHFLDLFFLLALVCINLDSVSAQTNLPELSIDISYDVYEESTAGNPSQAVFSIRLSEPSPAIVVVNFETVADTATAGADYIPRSNKVFFQPGQIFKTRTITLNIDTIAESTESFSMQLSNPVNATIAVDQASVNILDGSSGSSPQLSIVAADVSEAANKVTFKITLSQANLNNRVTVDYATTDGTAIANSDYTPRSGKIVFKPGQTTKYRGVSIIQDAVFEADETLSMQLTNPIAATLATASTTATITNDDTDGGNPQVSITGGTVSESDNRIIFQIQLSKPYATNASIDFETFNETAKDGLDFIGRSGKIYFQAGQTMKTRTVTILDDLLGELDETFGMRVVDNYNNETRTAFATISDNDANNDSVISLGSGKKHSCAVLLSGTVKCWGDNSYNALGEYTTPDGYEISPVEVVNITNAVTVTAADQHSCAMLANNEIWCWGSNNEGQLGTTSDSSYQPVKFPGTIQPVAIDAGGKSTCALTKDNEIYCWGLYGTPYSKVPDINNAASLSMGDGMGCALLSNQRVKCFDRDTDPVTDMGIDNAISISAGQNFACAVLQSGRIKCWGNNIRGQLGNGKTTDSTTPVDVFGIDNAIAVDAGRLHACALHDDGLVSCWGLNYRGTLGNGDDVSDIMSTAPVNVLNLDNVESLSLGSEHSCALTTTGVSCWGNNTEGMLGIGAEGLYTTIADDVSGITNATSADVGWRTSCASLATGGVKCWGENKNKGSLGNNKLYIDSASPDDVLNIDNAVSVHNGNLANCAILNDGTIKCWGANSRGILGNSSFTDSVSLIPIAVDSINNALFVKLSSSHACALLDDKTIKCWGENEDGQLGIGLTEDSLTPVEVPGISNAIAVDVSRIGATCVLLDTGSVKCWGRNYDGTLGNGSNVDSLIPADVIGINNATAISMNNSHVCALLDTGKIKCWGFNFYGQLGRGDIIDSNLPVEVSGIDNAIDIDVGRTSTCAVLDTGGIKCWGENNAGILGNGTKVNSSTPVDVIGINNAVSVHTDYAHSCALLNSGAMKCWGFNVFGEIGNGEAWNTVPVNVIGLF